MSKRLFNLNNVLALWVIPIPSDLKEISLREKEWSKNYTFKRANQFHHSRGYVRESLSYLWDFSPLEVPLYAPPGKPPELSEGYGYLSFSHCSDCLFIGWSSRPIGVDVEKVNRKFTINKLMDRLFSNSEIKKLADLKEEEKRSEFLKLWVIKEAAIKYQRGMIIQDFKQWNINWNDQKAFHKTLGYEVDCHYIYYNDWIMGIALDKDANNSYPIFCNSIVKI